jgi:disulfide bond formation protein DsbB
MLGLLALGMAAMTVVSYVLQFGFHVLPCPMCWWQRYIHYAILAVALVPLVAPKAIRPAVPVLILLALTGFSIGAWQFAAQQGWLDFPAVCSAAAFVASNPEDLLNAMQNANVTIPCERETFHLLGLTLAAWNMLAMAATVAWAIGTLCVAKRVARLTARPKK